MKHSMKLGDIATTFRSQAVLAGVVLVLTGIGIYYLSASRAATPLVATEPENGTVVSPATVVSDNTASGGKAVNFASTTTPTPTPPPSGSDPMIAIAGDIGYIDSTYKVMGHQQATGNLVRQYLSQLAAVVVLGDECYYNGTASDCNTYYNPYWGSFKSITKPTPGNHDYNTGGAGYYGYFGVSQYYSYNIGAWHFVSLNSQIDHSSSSAQNSWFKNDLAATNAKCVAAYAHYPRFVSGGKYGPGYSDMTALWQTMYNAQGDLFFAGHSHTYERFKPQDPNGTQTASGITEIVDGVGGADLVSGTTGPNTAMHINNNDGILLMTLHPTSYDWKFVNTNNQVLDSGSASCV